MTRLEVATAALQGLLASGHFTEKDDCPWFLIDPDAVSESRIVAVNAAIRLADELIERAATTPAQKFQ